MPPRDNTATADVDDHRAGRLRNGKACADRGRHGLLDQIDAPRACRQRRFLNRATLDRGRAGRHADDDHGIGEGTPVMHLADEVLDHLLCNFEIRDHAVAHGTDRFDIAGCAAQHHLGVVADCADMLLAAARHGGHDGGFVEDDAPPLHIDQRICGPEVDCHIARQKAEKTAEHAFPARSFPKRRLQ
jgi:hypothetical protein